MAAQSPLLSIHRQAEAVLVAYEAPRASGSSGGEIAEGARSPGSPGTHADDVLVVSTFGQLDVEYAAIRKHAAIFDQPHRAIIEVTGADRLDFLNRMLTQELKGIALFEVRNSFWLNRKGRIDADLRVINLPDRTLLDVDIHAAHRAASTLESYVITEDVQIRSAGPDWHRIAIHGRRAPDVLSAACTAHADAPMVDGRAVMPAELAPGRATIASIAERRVLIDRDDATGEPGYELTLAAGDAAAVYIQLLDRFLGDDDNHNGAAGAGLPSGGVHALPPRPRLRPIGWHAFNVARIEAGRPLYHLDFGPNSLPAETGILHERVSFTKGCYLGQEIVARMHARGHPKHVTVAVRLERRAPGTAEGVPADPYQPETGAFVYSAPASASGDSGETRGDAIGAVTSSAISPMLGSAPVCFAVVKFEKATPGAAVLIESTAALPLGHGGPPEGGGHPPIAMLRGQIQDGLVFWRR